MAQIFCGKTWRPGLLAALAVTFVAVLPSLLVWQARGGTWAGNDPSFSGDEVAYCAYVNALTDGRPRRNDPYTGYDATPHESLFSIQCAPPYLLAGIARTFSLSAPQVFILLNFLVPLATSLAIFWLFYSILGNPWQSAAGTVTVIFLGSYAILYGPLRELLGWDTTYTYAHLPFMRRYVPAVPFPVFWAFCACVWQALANAEGGTRNAESPQAEGKLGTDYTERFCHPRSAFRVPPSAFGAGLLFAVLVFSYFYLWTAALAWFGCCASLLWLGRPAERRQMRAPLLVILFFMLAALLPYGLLVLRRAPTMDTVQLLALSHAPDFSRSSVKLGLLVLLALALAVWRKRLAWREKRVLFAAACALAPLAMFNQQILTGHSLQPLHYEMYIAKYLSLLALCVAVTLWTPGKFSLSSAAPVVFCLALGWGIYETTIVTRRYIRNYALPSGLQPAAQHIRTQLAQEGVTHEATVLYADLYDADEAPTYTPQAVLWAPHLPAFAGVTTAQNKERIYQLMYYTGVSLDGVDEHNFEETDPRTRYLLHSLLEWALNEPSWTVNWQPLQPTKIRAEIQAYQDYTHNFSRLQAARVPLAYLVVRAYAPVDLTNFDRWYERDNGVSVGKYQLYRVQLRQAPASPPLRGRSKT